MAANELLGKHIDVDYASKIAKETLEKYFSFKDDPDARPDGYTKEDWERFMNFAKYPYYDTYAKSLFALKRYKEAIQYQRMAFDKPNGIPAKYFIDREGKLRFKSEGFDSDSELINEIDAMITILKSL